MTDWTKEARERCEKATPGPWTYALDDSYSQMPHIPEVKGHCGGCVGALAPYLDEDAYFIAAARTDLPRALDEIERHDEERAAYREALERICYGLQTFEDSWRTIPKQEIVETQMMDMRRARDVLDRFRK